MSSDKLSSPSPGMRPKRQLAREISALADVDLPAIFKHLPPYDRLRISKVCKRWHVLSCMPWRDIIHIWITARFQAQTLPQFVKPCPNLRNVTAKHRIFDGKELHIFSRISLSSLKLYACEFVTRIRETGGGRTLVDSLVALFSSNFRTAPWDELVLHNLTLKPADAEDGCYGVFPIYFPRSLKRLRISDSRRHPSYDFAEGRRWRRERLRLECLILRCSQELRKWPPKFSDRQDPICEGLVARRRLGAMVSLPKLRELILSFRHKKHLSKVLRLKKLEILFLRNTSTYFAASPMRDHTQYILVYPGKYGQ